MLSWARSIELTRRALLAIVVNMCAFTVIGNTFRGGMWVSSGDRDRAPH